MHVRVFLFSGAHSGLGSAEMELGEGEGKVTDGGSGQGWQEQSVNITAADSGMRGKLLVIIRGSCDFPGDVLWKVTNWCIGISGNTR